MDAIFLSLLNSHVTVIRRSTGQDSAGGPSYTWSTVAGTLLCRIRPTSATQQVLGDFMLYAQWGADLRDEDRIFGWRDVYGTAHTLHGNKTYTAKFIGDAAGEGHHVTAFLKEASGKQ